VQRKEKNTCLFFRGSKALEKTGHLKGYKNQQAHRTSGGVCGRKEGRDKTVVVAWERSMGIKLRILIDEPEREQKSGCILRWGGLVGV